MTKDSAENKDDSQDNLPLITPRLGIEICKVIVKLQKAPRVVDALQGKTDQTTLNMVDIFDDFDSPQAHASAKKEVKEIPKLTIDNT